MLTCRGKHQCQEWCRWVWYQLWSSLSIESAQHPDWFVSSSTKVKVCSSSGIYKGVTKPTWLTISLSLTLVFLSSVLALSTCRKYDAYQSVFIYGKGRRTDQKAFFLLQEQKGVKTFLSISSMIGTCLSSSCRITSSRVNCSSRHKPVLDSAWVIMHATWCICSWLTSPMSSARFFSVFRPSEMRSSPSTCASHHI